jgi:hypothetical protein
MGRWGAGEMGCWGDGVWLIDLKTAVRQSIHGVSRSARNHSKPYTAIMTWLDHVPYIASNRELLLTRQRLFVHLLNIH